MGLGDLTNKAKNALSSEEGERKSDNALDRAARFADEKTGGKYDEKIADARDAVDDRIGNDGADDASRGDASRGDAGR